MQLVLFDDEYKTKADLVNHDVTVTGTLTGAITGHHHTPLLLQVVSLTAQ